MKTAIDQGSPVIEADGGLLTPRKLPPHNLTRWVARRKAEVVAAVHDGLLTMPQACHRYRLTVEEFRDWERRYETGGLEALRMSAKHRPH